MRIAVVVPSWRYWANPKKLQPLWELYYATLIRARVPDAEVVVHELREEEVEASTLPEADVYFWWIMKSADALEVGEVVATLRERFRQARHFAGGNHVDHHPEEMVRLAAESGCVELALGLENVESDRVLEIINKPSKSVAANKEFIGLLKKYGIRVKVCLILGLPGETDQVLDRTIRFLEDVRLDYVAVSGFDPVPGWPIARDPAAYGIRYIDPDLSRHAHPLYRFGEDEDVGLPFEYEEQTPFGPGRRREAIVSDLNSIQGYLRENGMCY